MWYLKVAIVAAAVVIGLIWDEPIPISDKLLLVVFAAIFWPLLGFVCLLVLVEKSRTTRGR